MDDDFFGIDDTPASPVLVSSTGKNDTNSGSAWGSGLLNFFTGATGTAGNVLTALNQTDAQKAQAKQTAKLAAANASAQQSSLTRIVLLSIGGVIVVVLLVVLFKRGR